MSVHALHRAAACIAAVSLCIVPAYGLDNPGLKQRFDVETGGYVFEVVTTSNFDVTGHEFVAEERRLTLFIDSNVEDNISEMVIPVNLINGNFTFMLNGEELLPLVRTGGDISFITAEFSGSGEHRLDIVGTTYLPEFAGAAMLVLAASIMCIVLLRNSQVMVR